MVTLVFLYRTKDVVPGVYKELLNETGQAIDSRSLASCQGASRHSALLSHELRLARTHAQYCIRVWCHCFLGNGPWGSPRSLPHSGLRSRGRANPQKGDTASGVPTARSAGWGTMYMPWMFQCIGLWPKISKK